LKAGFEASDGQVRLTKVLEAIGGRATWYRREAACRRPATPQKPPARHGPQAREISSWEGHVVETTAQAFPWYGYKKIALICARLDEPVAVRKVYRIMKAAGLLHRLKKRTEQRIRQEVARLYQLLPKKPNELWQTDVTYILVPGYGWWYAITVIDYYSRYLLALHFTHSYSALEASRALRSAVEEAQGLHGPLSQPVFLVTDNGPSFIAHRFRDALAGIQIAATGLSAFSQVRDRLSHADAARVAGALPRDTQGRGGLLESVCRPLGCPAEAGDLPGALQPGSAALGPGARRCGQCPGPGADAARGLR
jgi:transposase InsO family protein